MLRRRRSPMVLLVLLLAVSALPAAGAQEPSVQEGASGRWVVEFDERPDLGDLASIRDRAERGGTVASRLQAAADRSQQRALEIVAGTPGASAESFWVRNALVVEGPQELTNRLRRLPGVAKVRPERSYPMIQPVERHAAEPSAAPQAVVGDPEWGVERIGADVVWSQGILGSGVVVASLDSGVQFDHPAIVDSYRGNNGDGTFTHDYNWFDATGICPTDDPCDEYGHGTHTMGTMVGGDGPGPFTPDIGVAPGAEWMSVSCGPFFCNESELMAAGQYFITPTDANGENPDPAMAPDVINNSWGGPPGDPFFIDMVEAWRAAGMIPVFASGNPGPFCGAGDSPGDYLSAFSVGATDIADVIAEFSGRGPSVYGKINPDVSAPGVNVLSSVPGNGYEAASGTSMAAPHAVGALALVLSSAEDLIGDVDGATDVVAHTAMDIVDTSCGGDADGDPNNVYGEGRIDVATAVAAATGGTLEGVVTATDGGAPIAGATVTADDGTRVARATTDAAGAYRLFLAEGSYDVTASAFAYLPSTATGVEIVVDQTTVQDFSLGTAPTAVVSGTVRGAEAGNPVEGVTVSALGTPVAPAVTAADGSYWLELPLGSYTLEAGSGGCYGQDSAAIDLTGDATVDFELARKVDAYGHVCAQVPFSWVDGDTQIRFGRNIDDGVRAVRLPFRFEFYGKSYGVVYVTTNGYVSFERTGRFSPFFNTEIPDPEAPNAAIYANWDDLIVDSDARVMVGGGEEAGEPFVIEYENIPRLGSNSRASFEIQLWPDGTIDVLYGDDMANLGSGGAATIGLENPGGTDALQVGFDEPVALPGTAWRYTRAETAVIVGRVVDANDRAPVAGATVSASPGRRSTTTGEQGLYRLTVLPGTYRITASADDYVSQTKEVVATDRHRLRFRLRAARLEVQPTELAAETTFGETAAQTLTLSNTGSAPLEWELLEFPQGYTPPELPAAFLAAIAPEGAYEAQPRPAGSAPQAVGAFTFDGPLLDVIDDPLGDSLGTVDVDSVRAGVHGGTLGIAIDYASAAMADQAIGVVHLDTDQDPSTGLAPEDLFGLPTQDIGLDYFVEFYEVHGPNPFVVVWTSDFEFVGEAPAEVDGATISMAIPLAYFGDEDGLIDVVLNTGVDGPEDWAPDVGHGTITPFSDAPWIAADPTAGTLRPGQSTEVTVTLGGEGVLPGTYDGALIALGNDPRIPRIDVPVHLDVALPVEFGLVSGQISDEVRSNPVDRARVIIDAEFGGSPVPISVTTGDDGAYTVPVPEGTWPVTVAADGYVTFEGEVTAVAGESVVFDVALVPDVARLSLSMDALSFSVPTGETGSAELELSNDGTQPLEWDIVENLLPSSVPETIRPTAGAGSALRRVPAWGPSDLPDGFTATAEPTAAYTGDFVVIIDDPAGDAAGLVDITTVEAGADEGVMSMTISFAEGTPTSEVVGYVLLDTDQNTATGLDPEDLSGLSTQEVGVDYFADLFSASEGIIFIVDEDFFVVAEVGVTVTATSVSFEVPLDVFGPDEDGDIDVAMVLGDLEGPSDWAPDTGNGEILPFTDAPWLEVSPPEGTIQPGETTVVDVTVDAAGLDAGPLAAELIVRSNDPFDPRQVVSVAVDVVVP